MINAYVINEVAINGRSLGESEFLLSLTDSLTLDDTESYLFLDGEVSFSDVITFVSLIEGTQKKFWSSTLSLTDDFVTAKLVSITDAIAFSSVVECKLVQHQVEFSNTFAITDTFNKIVKEALVDAFALSDTLEIGKVLAVIVDALGLDDSFTALITVTHAISSVFGLQDSLSLRSRIELTDALSLADVITWRIRQILAISDTTELTDTLSSQLTLLVTLQDTFATDDSFFTIIQQVLTLNDTFGVVGTFRIEGEDYLVWGINPKTTGAYKLKYPKNINSFERIGGKNLIAAADGIYEISGDDDDGTDIEAFLKTGFEDFNDPERHYPGEKIKQLLNAYLVMTAEDETLLKVISTRRGTAIETWFKCRAKPSVVSKTQIPLSNSLRSILFQFEISPLKNKPMKIQEVEIIPLFLSRSI